MNSIWYNQPGIGLSGTGYIEQAFRWAHTADPAALLFYNDYGIEDTGNKFQAVYNMVSDFVARGVPINGVGFEMHIDTSGYPTSAGLQANIQRITALGLQVHITEMDVRVPVDASGNASPTDLAAQAQTYQRVLSVCLATPGCTAFQTWGFSDKYSWIPQFYTGMGAALPFDLNYQPKPVFSALLTAMQ
jgi:endo-1,4-beta-xylanase